MQERIYKKFFRFIDINQYRSVLCLNGQLPAKEMFQRIDLPIIAADSAANYLHDNNIDFEVVIGDMDGVRDEVLSNSKNQIKLMDQDENKNDFQKAMHFMNNNNLLPTIIFGISGGYIDHIFNNIAIFCNTNNNVFFANNIIGIKLFSKHIFNLDIGTKISIAGVPNCSIQTYGLKWELNNHTLSYLGENSFFNRVISKEVKINILSGGAIMMVYLEEIIDSGLR
ncbi:MAG: thiamine diphosphokinase [Holosporales bacterium]|nr:thiamine diphosphokinase [Holosporales bacterium]